VNSLSVWGKRFFSPFPQTENLFTGYVASRMFLFFVVLYFFVVVALTSALVVIVTVIVFVI